MKRLSVRGVDLHVVVRGSGMPLLLVHAFPLDHSMWSGQIERFSSQAQVIAPDLRGFGLSGVTAGTVTMEQMADDLASILDQLAVTEPVVLCGLSMGGYAAFQFARKYPQKLRALVLCNTRSAADAPEARQATTAWSSRSWPSVGPVADAMVPRCFTTEIIGRIPGTVEFVRERILLTAPRELSRRCGVLPSGPTSPNFSPAYRSPTLVVAGSDDVIARASEMRTMAAAITEQRIRRACPEVGHLSALEAPVEFNSVMPVPGSACQIAGAGDLSSEKCAAVEAVAKESIALVAGRNGDRY